MASRQQKMLGRFAVTKIFGFAFILIGIISIGCSKHSLRGTTTESPDGKTYLSVDDDNGGKCGPLTVDGKPWLQKIGQAGLIEPGTHRIQCGGWVDFEIPAAWSSTSTTGDHSASLHQP